MPNESFNQHPSWHRYRQLLRRVFGLDLPEAITEVWQEVRGHRLRMDVWDPESAAKGTIILVHGAGGHGRLLAPFAAPLCQNGWRVLSPDLPGYGLTQPDRSKTLKYAEWVEIIAELANAQPGPVVLVGASMGGLTAVYAAIKTARVSGCFVTTLIDLSKKETFAKAARWPWLGWLSVLGFTVMPWALRRFKMPLKLVAPLKAMSANRTVQAYFQDDLLLGRNWLPLGFWESVFKYRVTELALTCPLWLVHPGEDDWTPLDISLQTFERIQAEKDIKVLSNGSHLPLEQPAFAELSSLMEAFLATIVEEEA
ncbi:MAG: alpha/beta hydrolase [Pseudomonadota bacterium]